MPMCDFLNCLWDWIKDLPYSIIADVLVAITSVVALCYTGKAYKRENENRKMDIKLQQWNALYPHRLEFYTDFYKSVFDFLHYNTNEDVDPKQVVDDMDMFFKNFEIYNKEVDVLFSSNDLIKQAIHRFYTTIIKLKNEPLGHDNNMLGWEIIRLKYFQKKKGDFKDFLEEVRNIQTQLEHINQDFIKDTFKTELTIESKDND